MQDYQPRMLSTYALTLFRHNANINGEDVKVDFWDTAGQERFNSMHPRTTTRRTRACCAST